MTCRPDNIPPAKAPGMQGRMLLAGPASSRGARWDGVAGRSGSALIVALWVTLLLSLIVGAFAFDMHMESRIASYYRKRMKAESLARAGIERARMLLIKSGEEGVTSDQYKGKGEPWYSAAKTLALGSAVNGYEDKLKTGACRVDVVPEVSRRNVNRLTRADWEKVFEVAGIPEQKWDELMDCFEDWLDGDDLRRTYGAETDDWYNRQETPYRAKNGPLYTVEEILLIKGFVHPMLYGGVLEGNDDAGEDDPEYMSGMDDLLTTFGDGKVNVNAASQRVLLTLPGITEDTAKKIQEDREGYGVEEKEKADHSFKSVDDFFQRFPDLRAGLQNSITTGTGIYRITSVGDCKGVTRRISCIATVDCKTGVMSVVRWLEGEGE